MKKNFSTRPAFINPRALIGFVLLLMGALLALFAGQRISFNDNARRVTPRDGSVVLVGFGVI